VTAGGRRKDSGIAETGRVMGDNRDNSADSRVLSQVGYVPFENLIGRAQVIFFSVSEGAHAWEVWRWPGVVRWGRLLAMTR
jgi:signal peptidase I